MMGPSFIFVLSFLLLLLADFLILLPAIYCLFSRLLLKKRLQMSLCFKHLLMCELYTLILALLIFFPLMKFFDYSLNSEATLLILALLLWITLIYVSHKKNRPSLLRPFLIAPCSILFNIFAVGILIGFGVLTISLWMAFNAPS